MASTYVPLIISYIEQQAEAFDICKKIGLCKESQRVRAPLVIPKGGEETACDLCKDIIAKVEEYLNQGQTQEQITELIVNKVCPLLPDTYKVLCTTLAGTYVPLIIKYLEQQAEAFDICKKIGLCKESQRVRAPLVIPKGVEETACDLCKDIIADVEKYLNEGQTQEQITELIVNKVCPTLPDPYKTLCTTMASTYVPLIIKYIEQQAEAFDICKKIGLCKDTQRVKQPRQIRVQPRNAQKRENGAFCSICKDFIDWSEKEIKEYSVPALWKLISVDCMKVPHLSKFCAIITENDISTILNLIISKLPSQKVCEWIKFC